MAGYSPLNLLFRPMSYEEMIAPIIAADTEHKALEEHYGLLDTMASVWEHRLAGEAEDSATRKLFTNYIEGLRDAAGLLGKEGLTHGSRRALMQMKSRFAGEITPIEEAYTLRQTLAEERRQAKLQDPTLIGGEDIAGMSLDEFLLNPTKAYNSISGAHITNMVATAAQQLTKTMLEHPEGWDIILDGEQFQRLLLRGFRPEEVMQAIRDYGSPEGNAMLEQIVREAIELSGVEQWGNDAQIQEAIDYALQGLYHAIGEDQFERAPRGEYLNPLERLKRRIMESQLREPPKDDLPYSASNEYFDINKHNPALKSINDKLFDNDRAINPDYEKEKGDSDENEIGINPDYEKMYGNKNPLIVYEEFKEKGGSEKLEDKYQDRKVEYNRMASDNKYSMNNYHIVTSENVDGVPHMYIRDNKGFTFPADRSNLRMIRNEEDKKVFESLLIDKEYMDELFTQSESQYTEMQNPDKRINKKEYQLMLDAGITHDDDLFTVQQKLTDYTQKQSRQFSGYSLNLPEYTYIENKIHSTVTAAGRSDALTRLNNDFTPKNERLGSVKGKTWHRDGFKVDNDIKGKINDIQFIPKAGGFVIFTTDGKLFRINPGAIKTELNFVNRNAKIIQELLDAGNIANAVILIQETINAAIPQITHSENPLQSKTSPYPKGIKPN